MCDPGPDPACRIGARSRPVTSSSDGGRDPSIKVRGDAARLQQRVWILSSVSTVVDVPVSADESPQFRSCGVRIDALSLDAAAEGLANRSVTGAVHLCNAYTLSLASRDVELTGLLERSTLNLPDGMPLVWIARSLGIDELTGRVYGPDLMGRTLDLGRHHGTRHFLLGSTDPVLDRLRTEIQHRWPGATVVGTHSPPFTTAALISEESHARIVDSGADVIWVGLGTPKQDVAAQLLAERHDAAFVAVGAAFEFIAGTKRQAPRWIQRSGLEWGYRLVTEPRRLWRRYLIGNSRFIYENLRRPPTRRLSDLTAAPGGAGHAECRNALEDEPAREVAWRSDGGVMRRHGPGDSPVAPRHLIRRPRD